MPIEEATFQAFSSGQAMLPTREGKTIGAQRELWAPACLEWSAKMTNLYEAKCPKKGTIS